MSNSWHSQKERSNPLTIRLIKWIALNLGRPAARLLLYPITFYFLIFATEQRQASLLYLNRILNRKPSYMDVAKHIHCFASTILDRVYLLTGQFEKLDILFPEENMPLKFSQQGKGCILLGSHIGSFEVLRSYGVRKCPLPIKILMYEGHNPMIVKVLYALNSNISEMVIPLGAPDSLLQVKDAVDAGSAVGMLGDRIMEMDSNKTGHCILLGKEIELPVAPILIAASLKVPLIAFFGIYLGGNQYQIHFELLSEKITLDRNNRQQDLDYWLQQYANIIEKHIKKSPFNWFNFYDYWQEQK
jgi:predicted LPLAT superfamily acyltransferase